jgi:hypothetical protein
MKVTEFGIVMLDNDEHTEKQWFPIEVTEFGMVMFDNDEHTEKP